MRIDRGRFHIDLAGDLIEAALRTASKRADPSLRDAFYEELVAVEGIEIIDIREERMRALDNRWVEAFELSQPLEQAVDATEGLSELVSGCAFRLARVLEDEGTALEPVDGASGDGAVSAHPTLVIQVRPDTLLETEKLRGLLSRAVRELRVYGLKRAAR